MSLALRVLLVSCGLFLSLSAQAADNEGSTLLEKAQRELTIPDHEKTEDIRTTPATVRLNVEAVESPISPTALQVGLSIQSYAPHGQGEVVGQAPVNWNQLGETQMVALDFRWLPYELSQNIFLGGFTSLGYGSQNLKVSTPLGEPLKSTRLHCAKWALGGALEYQFSDRFSLAWTFGGGQWHAIQSSSSAFANSSRRLGFLSSGFFAQVRVVSRLKAYLGYDYRREMESSPEIGVPPHNYLLGILWSLN